MSHQSEIKAQTGVKTRPAEMSAPWLTPGAEKEAWKNQGNRYDYRDLKASRPSSLKITISGPRQFRGV